MSIKENIGQLPDLRWVHIDKIIVDSSYQRELNMKRVEKIAEGFEWRHFGALVLSQQGHDTYAVTEGQHRLEAARLHPRIDRVPAVVISGMDLKAEAANFVKINTARAAVSTVDRFWAAITAEDESALRLRRVLKSAGCDVVPAQGVKKPNLTNAVTAVERGINRFGERAVRLACTAIRESWPEDPNALKGIIITSLGRMFSANKTMSSERMVTVLRANDLATLAANADAMRKIMGGSAELGVCRTLEAAYNKGLRKGTIAIGESG